MDHEDILRLWKAKLVEAILKKRPATVKNILDECYAYIVRTQEQQPCSSTSAAPNSCTRKNFLATLFGKKICQLPCAVEVGDVETVSILLDAGADINAVDPNGYTPLAIHVYGDEVNDDMTRLLLERKARPNGNPWLPLHRAAKEAKMSTMKILLEYGADPNAKEETDDETPLCMVVSWPFLINSEKAEVVKLLLEFGADPAVPSTRRDNVIGRRSRPRKIPEEDPRLPVFPFGQALMCPDPVNKLLPVQIVQDFYRCRICPMLIPFSEYIVDSLVKEKDFDHLTLFLQTGILFHLRNTAMLFRVLQPLVEQLQKGVDCKVYGKLMKCLIDLSPSCVPDLYERLPQPAQEEVMSLEHLASRRVREMYFVDYDPSVIAKRLVQVLPQRIFHQIMGVWVADSSESIHWNRALCLAQLMDTRIVETPEEDARKLSPPSAHKLTPPSAHKLSPPSAHKLSPPSAHKLTPPSAHEPTPPSAHKLTPPIVETPEEDARKLSPPSAHKLTPPSAHKLSPPSAHKLTPPSAHKLTPPSAHEPTPPSAHKLNSAVRPQADSAVRPTSQLRRPPTS
ncbi:unnamed protein product [Cyprideis torosa]|uniref:Uncharacterized protein n=1 Tax=Cyprideis torosa TaxID=163714 RepID=A0A7R8W6L1_9CRUS|nr:unnamed protein product [Cyprideis torosa]CAG0886568.1 unnamed protein product [Cyprideis torosa]